jgi:YhcH/YjgK/YiaL family protein
VILDSLSKAELYYGVSDEMAVGLKWLQQTDLSSCALGRHEIEGSGCYALVMEYETNPVEDGVWEAHRKYIDVQAVVAGAEWMGRGDIADMTTVREYDESGDALLLSGTGDFFTVPVGNFVVFFPHDAHMPSVTADSPQHVRKAVVKVPV